MTASIDTKGKKSGLDDDDDSDDGDFSRADGGKSFYTSLGHINDFHGPVLPPLLLNAIEWCFHD